MAVVKDGRCACPNESCEDAGKHPRVRWREADPDRATVEEWWRRWPDSGIGLLTGSRSGLTVLDVDPRHGGDESLHELESKHGELPPTPRVETGSGGEHHYFAHVDGARNSASKLGEGLDVRGEGGFVVAPPSAHASGGEYCWDVEPDEAEPAPPPSWLLKDARKRRNGATKIGERIPFGRQHHELVSLAGTMRRRGMDEAAIGAALKVTNRTRCEKPGTDEAMDEIARSVCNYKPADLPERTDLGNAELFCRLHSEHVRHVKERREWLHWRDGRWRRDVTGEAARAAKSTARELLRLAVNLEGDEQKQAVRWALASQSDARVRAMLSLASTEPEIVLAADELDADPFAFAVANGVLDLRSGELREPDPAELLTLGTEVVYDPDADCPRWLRFLDEIFAGDQELVGFVRRLLGYCLTGDTREHVLVVFHGGGWNGKTTLIAALRRLLGEHAVAAAFETFMRQRDRGPRNDLARLHRARLVTAAESSEGRRLDEATVKEVTGGDAIAARFLYGEHFEFVPRFKLVLVTNHRPKVDGDDDAIWRRIRLVPFEQSFEGREDKELVGKLEAELPGILAWAVEGCLEWQADGLGEAGAVTRATAEYRQDEDVLGSFLADRCEMSGDVPTTKLREAYESYCEELGERPLAANILGRRLGKRGIRRAQSGKRRFYEGVSLS